MRVAAWCLVAVLAGLPVAQAVGTVAAPDACPMTTHAVPDGCCLFAPCPCEHSAPETVAPLTGATILASSAGTPRPLDLTPTRRPEPLASLRAGHPRPIEHPPSRRV